MVKIYDHSKREKKVVVGNVKEKRKRKRKRDKKKTDVDNLFFFLKERIINERTNGEGTKKEGIQLKLEIIAFFFINSVL